MSVDKAVAIIGKEFPGRKAIGYWNVSDGIVINLAPEAPAMVCGEICHVLVKTDGTVKPTNPMLSRLDVNKRIDL